MLSLSPIDQVHSQLHRLYNDISTALHYSILYNNLLRLHNFISHHHLIVPIITYLQSTSTGKTKNILEEILRHGTLEYSTGMNETDIALSCMEALKQVQQKTSTTAIFIGKRLVPNLSSHTNNNPIYAEAFAQVCIKPLIDFIIDNLTNNYIILNLLLRYQKKCEWFKREELYELYKNNTNKGELILNSKLYEYLFDSGIDIQIEPQSISGRVDFMTVQTSDEPIVADGKVFKGNRKNILDGTYQLYQYAVDHQRINGYLVVYNVSDSLLTFATNKSAIGVPYITVHHKNLHFIVIDLYSHSDSASKRGNLRTIQITEEQLVQRISEQEESPAEPGLSNVE